MVHGASFKLVGGENHSSSILPAERWVASSNLRQGRVDEYGKKYLSNGFFNKKNIFDRFSKLN